MPPDIYSNARSTKTRIETYNYVYRLPWLNPDSNARSTKTRIETLLEIVPVYEYVRFECKIH